MAIHLSLRVAPLDLQQGGNSRIPYVHVPAARMSILVYIATAINTFLFLLTKHPLFLRSSGTGTEMGAFFTLFTLVTGGFRGRPMWGTFWVWDARLTSVFISFFIYLGALRFQKLSVEPASISICAGPIDIPIIKSSVNWWNTSHQPGSISRSGTSIHVPMPIPILSNFANSPSQPLAWGTSLAQHSFKTSTPSSRKEKGLKIPLRDRNYSQSRPSIISVEASFYLPITIPPGGDGDLLRPSPVHQLEPHSSAVDVTISRALQAICRLSACSADLRGFQSPGAACLFSAAITVSFPSSPVASLPVASSDSRSLSQFNLLMNLNHLLKPSIILAGEMLCRKMPRKKRIRRQSHCLQGNKPLAASGFTKIKHKADGSIERYKARLLEQGFLQEYHVEKITTIRGILSLAAIKKWPLFQLDVKNAFQQHKEGGFARISFYSASSNYRLLFSGMQAQESDLRYGLRQLKKAPRADEGCLLSEI
uniref:Cytochrome c assembly protein domain-containing protein n=1 Tax=Salix viminalis TaxID=40686 RepID=A0A6N2MX86_SALVM